MTGTGRDPRSPGPLPGGGEPPAAGRAGRFGVRQRLYLLAWFDELGPLYALYTLWFNDNGITTAQISTVFLLWAAVAIALEIPSGALADLVDKRVLLAFAFALRAIGIGWWLVSPSFNGVVIGALLWATHSALASGAWEALIHDELEAVGEASAYGPVMARAEQFSDLGIAVGTVAAFVLLELGASILALGWITVGLHVVTIGLVLSLPAVGRLVVKTDSAAGVIHSVSQSFTAWWSTLVAGARDAAGMPELARLVVLGAFVEGLFLFDEYVPLLGRDRGVADSIVPFLVLVVWVGRLLGSELAARRPNIGPKPVAGVMMVGTGAMLAALVFSAPAALALIAVGYLALQIAWIVSGARLQERLTADRRATVTSIRGFFGGIINTGAFAVVAVMADGDDPRPGLLVALGVLFLVAVATLRLLPPSLVGRSTAATA